MKQEIIEKGWGRERVLEANDKYAFKILEVDPGKRLSLQYHEVKTETMYCLYGMGTLYIKDHDTGEECKFTMMPGRYRTIWPFDVHRLEAAQDSPIIVLEASSPELIDVVRLQDDYGRNTEFNNPFLNEHGN